MQPFKDQQARLRCSRQASNNVDFAIPYITIPCGLVARIRRFHRRGRGSIPRKGVNKFSRNLRFHENLKVDHHNIYQ